MVTTYPTPTGRRNLLRLIEFGAWFGVAGMTSIVVSQYVYRNDPAIAAAHTVLPYLLMPSIPVAFIASLVRRSALAVCSGVIGVVLLAYTFPVVFPPDIPSIPASAPRITILEGNLAAFNGQESIADTLVNSGADVLVLVEYTNHVNEWVNDAGAADIYPYSWLNPGGSDGTGIWSKYPLSATDLVQIRDRPASVATLTVEGHDIRIIAVHPRPPTTPGNAENWEAAMPLIGDLAATPGPPTMIVGDFNASRWHPVFRELLDRGWRDAHEWLGHGFGASWPNDRKIGPWVRLDHALLGSGLAPVSIHDIDLPGSDHRGFIVTVAPV